MIDATTEKLAAFVSRNLDDVDLVAMFIDGIEFARHAVLIALGVTLAHRHPVAGRAHRLQDNGGLPRPRSRRSPTHRRTPAAAPAGAHRALGARASSDPSGFCQGSATWQNLHRKPPRKAHYFATPTGIEEDDAEPPAKREPLGKLAAAVTLAGAVGQGSDSQTSRSSVGLAGRSTGSAVPNAEPTETEIKSAIVKATNAERWADVDELRRDLAALRARSAPENVASLDAARAKRGR